MGINLTFERAYDMYQDIIELSERKYVVSDKVLNDRKRLLIDVLSYLLGADENNPLLDYFPENCD